MRKTGLILVLLTLNLVVFGQAGTVYQNRIYKSTIKTVECYNAKKEQSVPIIALGSTDQLTFAFDDLQRGNRDYAYTLEHCTADWKPSRLSSSEYMESFSYDRILSYRLSFNTIQKYTHYEIKLPNDQVRPRISGNFILKVYQEGKEDQPIITQRIYVLGAQVGVNAEVVPSMQVSERFSSQKVNFTITHNFPIQNPANDVKVLVMQNMDPLTAVMNTRPSFIRNNTLVYNDPNTNDFPGGNEFRKLDFRSLKFKGTGVQDIYRDSVNTLILYQDKINTAAKYASQFDEDGNFFIRNQDGNRDGRTEGDYANVMFSLSAPAPENGTNIYVAGRFNNYALTEENRMRYVADRRAYYTNIQLKQGLYDYKYVKVGPDGVVDSKYAEGSFFETDNTYQVFVYYRRPGGRWDELIGFTSVESLRR